MKQPDHYFAIDPGEVHVGFASLYIDDDQFTLHSGVLHRPSRTFPQLVDQLMKHLDCPTVWTSMLLVESYQARAVGHQRFSSGETLQLVGALRYATERDGRLFATIMPGDAKKDLRALRLQPLLDEWIPQPRPSRWEHAFSAWRVLGRFMLGHNIRCLQSLGRPNAEQHGTPENVCSAYKKDLIAPTLLVSR
jgi:hypothetical protein